MSNATHEKAAAVLQDISTALDKTFLAVISRSAVDIAFASSLSIDPDGAEPGSNGTRVAAAPEPG